MRISGKDLSARLKAEMAERVAQLKEKYGREPHPDALLTSDTKHVLQIQRPSV